MFRDSIFALEWTGQYVKRPLWQRGSLEPSIDSYLPPPSRLYFPHWNLALLLTTTAPVWDFRTQICRTVVWRNLWTEQMLVTQGAGYINIGTHPQSPSCMSGSDRGPADITFHLRRSRWAGWRIIFRPVADYKVVTTPTICPKTLDRVVKISWSAFPANAFTHDMTTPRSACTLSITKRD